jgi:hypothetical protein
MKFFLGAHHADWLGKAGVPLFVSRRTLAPRRTFPRATAPWALDSGGFTELSMHGTWTLSARDYATEAHRFRDEIGSLEFAAPQDWMCEPRMLAKTGLTVEEHQRRSVANYIELQSIAPDVPWIPVLQGWTLGDYERHVEDYYEACVDLAALPLVGVGTVCRRQNTIASFHIFSVLHAHGLKLHGFGLKMTGLRASAQDLASADSMAWSYSGRRNPPIPGHEARHKNCANCPEYAASWREEALESIRRGCEQLSLGGVS